MTKWLLYLLLAPIMTPQERADVRAHLRERMNKFKCEYLIADEELSKKLDEIDRDLKDKGE